MTENTEIFDKEYLLIFNNISKLALTYKDRLVVKAANAPNNSNLIVVELVTPQLARDVDYLNQLGKIYIQFGLDEKNRVANNTIKFIDDQITGVNSSLQNTGDQFSSFRSQNKTIDLRQEAALVVDKLKKIEAERGEVDLKLDYYNNLNFYLDNRDQNRDMVAPSLSGSTDNALNSTVMKLNDLYSKREVLSYTVQEKNPALISLNNEISFNQKSLRETISNLIDNANAQIANLNIRQQTVNAELSKLPKTEQDLIGIKRNFDINNELYTFLLQRRAEAEIAKASNNPDAQILDPTDSEIAILLGPIFIINIIIGLFGGLFVAAGLVIVKEMGSETLTEIDDISSQLGVSVSGSIAMSKYKTERPVYEHPRSAVTESFRGLRVNIEYMLRESKGKILAIHSIISGEGKSFVAYNIALLFAMGNKKVLLVDGDLRKPRLHLLLDTDPGKGLSSYLEGRDEIKDIIQPTDVPNLSFVPTGPTRLNSSELLYSSRVKLFIDSVRDKYDFIIFDNSPIGLLYDGILIGAQADFNLILLRLNYSKSKEINSINKIGREGILKNVMVAVNGIKLEKGYGYYTEEGGKG